MSLQAKADSSTAASGSPYALDPAQTLRAANALLKKMQSDIASRSKESGKQNLLDDVSDGRAEPVWLSVTTKKHIVDQKRLKPGKIVLPHPITRVTKTLDDTPSTKVCLLTADPQRKYKDLVAHPNFPAGTRSEVARVLGLAKLKARYKSFESKRQLLGEYDIFLADDRIITRLPKLLGKTFYHTGAKRPIPVNLQGKKESSDKEQEKRKSLAQGGTKVTREEVKPEEIAREIERALTSALVHLSPSTHTSVKVGVSSQTSSDVAANVEAVVATMIKTYIPRGWRNVKSLHLKGPNTASLPIWLAEELWETENDVLEEDPVDRQTQKKLELKQRKEAKKIESTLGKRGFPTSADQSQAKKKRKSGGLDDDEATAKEDQKSRKVELQKLKEQARSQIKVAV